jgi:tRNA threonylcarbamoyladenosine biosynthesis protein TsaB
MLGRLEPLAALNVLALETSTDYCSVALSGPGRALQREAAAGQRHSELVLPMVDELLNEASLQLVDLDGIAFGAGPGSFTGLRIACGVAQGLAFGAGLKVAPVPTLLALAEACGAARVIACLDARMGEIYHGAYERFGDGWREVSGPVLCDAESAPLLAGEGWIGCGSGFDRYAERLVQRYGAALDRIQPGLFPHARNVARLGALVFAAGKGCAPEDALPLYVRDKVALKMDEQR